MAELLIGCGGSREKKLWLGWRKEWTDLTTLDMVPSHKPDVVHDLEQLPLPFPDESFEEIHAYEVLEHTGQQGDYRFFFAQFSDFWRLLVPGGLLIGSVPTPHSVWAWGDPSHKRVLPAESFVFLDQTQYTRQVGRTTMSDFRHVYRADFDFIHKAGDHRDSDTLWFILRAVKPSRIA